MCVSKRTARNKHPKKQSRRSPENMIGKIAGMIILGALAAVCFYSAGISNSSHDSQGYWFFLVFGMFFLVPMALVMINLIAQRSKVFKVYDKLAGTDRPETVRFVPHSFMMIVGTIILICLLSAAVRVVITIVKIVMGRV
jgi:hypothetical protein